MKSEAVMSKKTFVCVGPDGTIRGPLGDNEFVKEALIVGYRRTFQLCRNMSDDEVFKRISAHGYRVAECKIKLVEK